MDGIKMRAGFDAACNDIRINIRKYDGSDVHQGTLVFEKVDKFHCGFTTGIDMLAAQTLMDDLWRAGVRPTDISDIKALRDHLDDVRSLAFTIQKLAAK
jgi:hypothetical protein